MSSFTLRFFMLYHVIVQHHFTKSLIGQSDIEFITMGFATCVLRRSGKNIELSSR